jgi:UDP-N-acetylglucosamine 2-epimerase (non-hydrolysing)
LRVPNVTIRDVTERPETIECGSNVLAGADRERILSLVEFVTSKEPAWSPPEEYVRGSVSSAVCRILLGHRVPDAAELLWREGAPR